jgi:hypothetical protein
MFCGSLRCRKNRCQFVRFLQQSRCLRQSNNSRFRHPLQPQNCLIHLFNHHSYLSHKLSSRRADIPFDSSRRLRCRIATAVFPTLVDPSCTAVTTTVESPVKQRLSCAPATARADCGSQVVLESQSPKDPIAQSPNHYRSISPSTISIDPIAATTSASNLPSHILGRVCRFARQAARMCTR